MLGKIDQSLWTWVTAYLHETDIDMCRQWEIKGKIWIKSQIPQVQANEKLGNDSAFWLIIIQIINWFQK